MKFLEKLSLKQLTLFVTIIHLIHSYFGLQDFNWDFQNYHYYNGFAFFENRLGFDIAPGQLQTFFNPLGHLHIYLLSILSPIPWLVGAAQSVLHSLNFVLILLIFLGLNKSNDLSAAEKLLALVGIFSATHWGLVGTSFTDTLFSLFILGGLALLLFRHFSLPATVGAGLLLGLASGLKLTNLIFVLAFGLSLLLIHPRRVLGSMYFSLSTLLGIMLSGGFWFYRVWQEYGSPTFPFYNALFQSEHFPWVNLYNRPEIGFWESLARPIYLALGQPFQLTGFEAPGREPRYLILLVLFLLLVIMTVKRRASPKQLGLNRGHLFVFCFLLISWSICLVQFGLHRYAVSLDYLAAPAIWSCLLALHNVWARSSRFLNWAALSVAIICLVFTKATFHDRIAWSKTFLHFTPPSIKDPDHSILILAGKSPTSFMVPAFPKQMRFVRTNFLPVDKGLSAPLAPKKVHEVLAQHRGDLYVLYRTDDQIQVDQELAFFGLRNLVQTCVPPETRVLDRLLFCQLEKLATQ